MKKIILVKRDHLYAPRCSAYIFSLGLEKHHKGHGGDRYLGMAGHQDKPHSPLFLAVNGGEITVCHCIDPSSLEFLDRHKVQKTGGAFRFLFSAQHQGDLRHDCVK